MFTLQLQRSKGQTVIDVRDAEISIVDTDGRKAVPMYGAHLKLVYILMTIQSLYFFVLPPPQCNKKCIVWGSHVSCIIFFGCVLHVRLTMKW